MPYRSRARPDHEMLRDPYDCRGCGAIFPVARPDAEELDKFMFETDSPYEHRCTAEGGIEIVARGRSAVTLLVWLKGRVTDGDAG